MNESKPCPICGEPVGQTFKYLSDYRSERVERPSGGMTGGFTTKKRPVEIVCCNCFSAFETATRKTELFMQGGRLYVTYQITRPCKVEHVNIEFSVVEQAEARSQRIVL